MSDVGDVEFKTVSRNDLLVEEHALDSEAHVALCAKGNLYST